MENASKALLIAGGVLLAILVISLFVVMRGNLQQYFKAQDDVSTQEEIVAFNLEYTNYNRNNVRGNELLSLINKVIDYNERESEATVNNSQAPTIDLNIYLEDKRNKFIFDNEFRLFEKDVYKEKYNPSNKKQYVSDLNDIIGKIIDIENKYTNATIQKLCSRISTIYVEDKDGDDKKVAAVTAYNEIVGTLLKAKKYEDLKNNYDDICAYYEYSQFKKAIFECKDYNEDKAVEYNENGKIKEMTFVFTGKLK